MQLIRRSLQPTIAIGFAIIAWQLLVSLSGLPSFILPSPAQVALVWVEHRTIILTHAWVTACEVALGIVIGGALGFVSAIYLAWSPRAKAILHPILVFSQALPVFALAPILTLWLGYGISSKVAMAVLIIFFPVTASFLDGLNRTSQGYLDLARTMNATESMILWRIRVPNAMPQLQSGLRIAAVYAPIGAVIGEWVGASEGLGYLMLLANGRAKTDLMFAALLTLGIFAVSLHKLVILLTQRMAD